MVFDKIMRFLDLFRNFNYMSKFKKGFVLALLCFYTHLSLFAQTDTTFWFVAPDCTWPANAAANTESPIYLRLTSQNNAAVVSVSIPANPAFPVQTINLAANQVSSINLTNWLGLIENKPANSILNKGILIQSTGFITAYYEQSSAYNPDIFALKGSNALGTDFIIPTQNTWNNNTVYTPPAPTNSFEIVATEDNTRVTITPSNAITGHTAGAPFNITLNKGQTYSAVATGNLGNQHLAGSVVTSDKPIAITTKDDFLNDATYGTCSDLAGDQIVPVSVFGYKYISIHGFLNAPNDKVFIIGSQPNTTVRINGSNAGTIGSGQVLSKASNGAPMYIEADKPVGVFHISGFGCEVGGALLPSIECTGSRNVGITRSDSRPIYLLLLVPSGGETGFTFNGNSTVLPSSQFQSVPNTGNAWKYARIDISNNLAAGAAAYISNNLKDFHLGIIHGDAGGGCRYGYFSDFKIFDAKASSNSPVCEGNSLQLNCLIGTAAGVTFQWTGPNGFTSTLQNPVIANASASMAGAYTCIATKPNCSSITSTVNVSVNPGPVNDASSNSPVCSGSNLQLSASDAGTGTVYQWSGPNGFTSAAANAVINNVTTAAAGNYTLQITRNGCSKSKTIAVIINPANTVSASNSGPLCEGQNLQLTANSNNPSAIYSWTGPNGFSSNQQNPVISAAQSAASGTYTVTVSSASCNAAQATTNAVINPGPGAVAGGNSPICEGQALLLSGSSSSTGVTYSWTGPGGFSSTLQNPQLASATPANSGTYTLSVSKNGCTTTSTYLVQVFSKPVANPTVNAPVCAGSILQFNTTTATGFTYQWSGPNGFSSSIANPSIPQVSVSQAGTYTLQVSNTGCPDASAQVLVAVNPVPMALANAPANLCSGSTLNLQAGSTLAGSTYQWTGPGGFSSNIQNAQRLNTVTGWSGDYILTVSLNGCSSKDTVAVQIVPTPDASIPSVNPVCSPGSLQLSQSNPVTGSVYQWTGPHGFTSANASPLINPVQLADSGWYYLTIQAGICSDRDSVYVRTLQAPVVRFDALTPVCADAGIVPLFATETTGIAGTGSFSGTGVSGIEFNPQVAGAGSHPINYLFTAQNGCGSNTIQQQLVYDLPVVNAGADLNVLTGGSVTLQATSSVAAATIAWTPAATLSSPNQLSTIATPDNSTTYTINITDIHGCNGSDAVQVRVLQGVHVPSAFSPNQDGLNDRWNIPGLEALPKCDVSIYNRYGELIYHSKGYNQPWDGTYKGKPQPAGAYVYLIYLNDGLRKQPLKGTVVLLH